MNDFKKYITSVKKYMIIFLYIFIFSKINQTFAFEKNGGIFVENSSKKDETNKKDEVKVESNSNEEKKDIQYDKEYILKQLKNNEDFYVTISENGKEEKILFSEYIKGVAAAEIGFNVPKEAIISQIIAAISYCVARAGLNGTFKVGDVFQGYIPKEKRIEKYGKEKEELVDELVKKYGQRIMTYNGGVVEAVYSTSCPKYTNDNTHEWGNKYDIPYLSPVYSPEVKFYNDVFKNKKKKAKFFKKHEEYAELVEKVLDNVFGEKTFDLDEAYEIVKKHYPEAKRLKNSKKPIKILKCFKGGFVKKIKAFGVVLTGKFFRLNFGIKSSCFKVYIKGNKITFKTFGNGHCVGMSQAGAIIYAIQNKDHNYILKHYYSKNDNKNKELKFKQFKQIKENLLFKNIK